MSVFNIFMNQPRVITQGQANRLETTAPSTTSNPTTNAPRSDTSVYSELSIGPSWREFGSYPPAEEDFQLGWATRLCGGISFDINNRVTLTPRVCWNHENYSNSLIRNSTFQANVNGIVPSLQTSYAPLNWLRFNASLELGYNYLDSSTIIHVNRALSYPIDNDWGLTIGGSLGGNISILNRNFVKIDIGLLYLFSNTLWIFPPIQPSYDAPLGINSFSHNLFASLVFSLGISRENRQQEEPIREQQSRRRIRTHEQPDNSPAGLLARLRALGIAIEGRFDPVRTRSLVENRELIERLSHESNPRFTDNRPIAVFIDPTADHNGAFNSHPEKPINVLAADSRFFTLYYQVSTETELREALTTLTRVTGRRVHTLIIAGHGQRTQLQLGNPPSTSSDQDPYYLNSDEIMRGELDYLGDVMNPRQGDLLLLSCSNGAIVQQNSSDNSSLPLPNLATAVGNRVAGIDVYSTDTPSNIRSFRMREDLSMAVEWIEGTPYNIIRHNNRPSIPSIPPTSPSSPASR